MHFSSVSIRFKQHLPGVFLHGFSDMVWFGFSILLAWAEYGSSGFYGHSYGAFVEGLVSCLLAVSFGLHIVLWGETE